MAWKGVCAVCGILGNSLSIRAYSVMCYVFQVLARIAGRRQLDQYTLEELLHIMILGCDVMSCYVIQ